MSSIKKVINVQTLFVVCQIILTVVAALVQNWYAFAAAGFGLVGLIYALIAAVRTEREFTKKDIQIETLEAVGKKNLQLYMDASERLTASREEVLKLTEEIAKLVAAQQNPEPVEVVASASLEQEQPKKTKRTRSKKTVQEIKSDLKAFKDGQANQA